MDKLIISSVIITILVFDVNSDDNWVKPPSKCEVCKYLVTELQDRLRETGKYKQTIETGYNLDMNKKKIDYRTSELRLAEALVDPHICDRILQYNVHKEKEGSLRFAKGQSETMRTLHGLVNKGVKVDLGIPHDLWDSPSAEVTEMQKHCYTMVGDYEDEIEEWYFHHQDEDLADWLCAKRILKQTNANKDCLYEVEGKVTGKLKGDTGKPDTKKTEL
ncbi:protein canopy 4-like [Tubulanus polymorphus]|uniref:protein canopy 4-like n=1 Tax=Tubulanus polymorphus TaxID=672921 RepID=UPI003DA4F60D